MGGLEFSELFLSLQICNAIHVCQVLPIEVSFLFSSRNRDKNFIFPDGTSRGWTPDL